MAWGVSYLPIIPSVSLKQRLDFICRAVCMINSSPLTTQGYPPPSAPPPPDLVLSVAHRKSIVLMAPCLGWSCAPQRGGRARQGEGGCDIKRHVATAPLAALLRGWWPCSRIYTHHVWGFSLGNGDLCSSRTAVGNKQLHQRETTRHHDTRRWARDG